jgi:hypothetical protein
MSPSRELSEGTSKAATRPTMSSLEHFMGRHTVASLGLPLRRTAAMTDAFPTMKPQVTARRRLACIWEAEVSMHMGWGA